MSAPAIKKVPASMRSGMMVWDAPWRRGDAADTDGGGAGAVDGGSHGAEQAGKVDDFGLARGVIDDGFAGGEHGGHQHVFGAGDGDAVEVDFGAAQSVGRAGFDVAVFLAQLGAQAFEGGDVQVDGARADGAAAGEGDAGDAAAGHQRAEHEARRAHGLDQIVGGFGADDIAGLDGDASAVDA